MKTFKGAEVPPIDELLERTPYVQAKNAEIERLTAKLEAAQAIAESRKKGHAALLEAYGKVIHQCNEAEMERDELRRGVDYWNNRYATELTDLRRQLEEARRWQPVEEGDSVPVDCPAPVTITETRMTVGNVTIVFSDNYRLCRLVEGQRIDPDDIGDE